MSKEPLIEELHDRLNLDRETIGTVIYKLADIGGERLNAGKPVHLPGLGTLERKGAGVRWRSAPGLLEDAAETAEILRDHPEILERLERIREGGGEFRTLEEVAEEHGVRLR